MDVERASNSEGKQGAGLGQTLDQGSADEREAERRGRRKAAWEALGIDVPNYLDEKDMPAVDHAQLEAYVNRQLPPEEELAVTRLINRYRTWELECAKAMLKRHPEGRPDLLS